MGDVIASCITVHPNDRLCDNFIKEPIAFHIGNIYGDKKGRGFAGNVYDKDAISPTIMTNGGGNRQPMIFECCNQERKYGNKRVQSLVDSAKISGHEVQFLDAYNQTVSDICGTIKTTIDSSCLSFISVPDFANYRIRKLTPRECFRLMGVSEKDIDNIQKSGISKTQQYKMAGNSIVVDVLYHIFRKMFVDKKDENKQLSLF